MERFKNSFEIYKLLNRSNCKKCGERTCLAFAGQVFHEQKQLNDCPYVDQAVQDQYDGSIIGELRTGVNNVENVAESLMEKVSQLDFASIADNIGGKYTDDKLTVQVFGKDVHVTSQGKVISEIHTNFFVVIPILTYVLDYAKIPLTGKWVSFKELATGGPRYPLFRRRCELPMSGIADTYTDLFEDMIHVFQGQPTENINGSDISLVTHPLPLLPVLICYWQAEEGFESDFNFLFDSSAADNLDIEQIYTICAGMAEMFKKISIKHV